MKTKDGPLAIPVITVTYTLLGTNVTPLLSLPPGAHATLFTGLSHDLVMFSNDVEVISSGLFVCGWETSRTITCHNGAIPLSIKPPTGESCTFEPVHCAFVGVRLTASGLGDLQRQLMSRPSTAQSLTLSQPGELVEPGTYYLEGR